MAVAWHTVSNVYYVLRAARGDAKTRAFISDMLRFSAVASGGTEAVNHALSFSMDDFEDALQGAAAIASDAQFIITRNVCDYRRSPLPAMTPHNFLLRVCES